MTAEEGITRFPGIKAALWKFWDDKKPGTISEFSIMEYFRVNGHEGPLREMLYQLPSTTISAMSLSNKANTICKQL